MVNVVCYDCSRLLIKDPAKRPSASEVLKTPFIASEIEVCHIFEFWPPVCLCVHLLSGMLL